jgi:hypothetical protein
VDDSHRASVLTVLRGQQVPKHWRKMVEEVVELEQDYQGQKLGDSLPIELRLAAAMRTSQFQICPLSCVGGLGTMV